MEETPGFLAITGEPTRNERVENLIKLTLSLQMRGRRPSPWRSAFVPFGVFNTVRNLVVLTGSVADAWPHPDDPALLCDLSVVTEPHPSTTLDRTLLSQQKNLSQQSITGTRTKGEQEDGNGEEQEGGQGGQGEEEGERVAVPCSRCAAREVRKLSMLPLAGPAVDADETGAVVPLTQRLDGVMARSMVVYHNEPEIVFGKCGAASFTLRFRIVCYSTHHGRRPFRVVVRLYDSTTHTLVAQQRSLPITILDNHKSRPSAVAAAALDPAASSALSTPGVKRPPPPSSTTTAAAPNPHSSPRSSSSLQNSDSRPSSSSSSSTSTTSGTATATTILRVIPSSGTVAGGVPVVVLGTNLGSGGTLKFGGAAAADIQAHTDGALVCTLPPARHAGPVTVAAGTAAAFPAAFTYVDDVDERLWALARSIVTEGVHLPQQQQKQEQNESNESINEGGDDDDILRRALDTARAVLGGRQWDRALPERPNGTNSGTNNNSNSTNNTEEESMESVLVRVLGPLLATPWHAGLAWTRAEAETRRTLLHYAAAQGYCRLGTALLDAVPQLRDAADALGCTALHHAAMRGRGDFALLLLLRKASVAARDAFGRTPEAYEPRSSTDAALLASDTPLPRADTLLAVPTTPSVAAAAAAALSSAAPALSEAAVQQQQQQLQAQLQQQQPQTPQTPASTFVRYDEGTGVFEDNDPLLLFSRDRDEPDDGWVVIPSSRVLAAGDDSVGTPGDWARAHIAHLFVAGGVLVLGTLAVGAGVVGHSSSSTQRVPVSATATGTTASVHVRQTSNVAIALLAFGVFVATALASVARWTRRVRIPLVGTAVAAFLLTVHQAAVIANTFSMKR